MKSSVLKRPLVTRQWVRGLAQLKQAVREREELFKSELERISSEKPADMEAAAEYLAGIKKSIIGLKALARNEKKLMNKAVNVGADIEAGVKVRRKPG
jgi:hypothetical protein